MARTSVAPRHRERLERYDATDLALLAAAISVTLIVSRFAWVLPSVWLPRALSQSLRERDPMPPSSHATILSWAGMRGVVSLAAALALPAAFPGRDAIVFFDFCAALATLVLQGTTRGWVIRRFGADESEATLPEPETAHIRAGTATAALDAVKG